MAYFLVRLLVNALSVALTVALLLGIQLTPGADSRPITIQVFLVLGGLFS